MFLHPYLLAGFAACLVPVALHLLMRQKPRRLVFPAFRFLAQRNKSNQRRMRFQNLLLMLLRVAVLAALVLALARPRLSAGTVRTEGRPVRAVLLIDASPSMEYVVAGVSRLDEATRRASELLDEMGAGSLVAVLDSGDLADEPFVSVGEARQRLARLALRPSAGSLNRAVERGLDLLAREKAKLEGDDAPPLFLHVFTDRTRAAWDSRGAVPRVPEGVTAVVLDVGATAPRDLGIEDIEIVPPVVVPRSRYVVRVRLRGTPTGHDTEVSCVLDSGGPADRAEVKLAVGQDTAQVEFERVAPEPTEKRALDVPLGLTVSLPGRERMAFNKTRQATLLLRGSRRMLTITDDTRGDVWALAHEAIGAFRNEVRTPAEAEKLDPRELGEYAVIALSHPTSLPRDLGQALAGYVRAGGGLAILPGDKAFNAELADVLPAALAELRTTKPLYLARFSGTHPLTARLSSLERGADFERDELRPFARRVWRLGPMARGAVEVASYDAPGRPAALVERREGKGRVLLFTTPLDGRFLDNRRLDRWNNWLTDSSFGFVLMDQAARWLGGESEVPVLSFPCGVEAVVKLPSPLAPPYVLSGPGLRPAEKALRVPANGEAAIPQARVPGNYLLADARGQTVAGFSMVVPGGEGDLSRIESSELEAVFGKDKVRSATTKVTLDEGNAAPTELMPWLMMALLAAMAVEGLLANRYYRSSPESAPEAHPA